MMILSPYLSLLTVCSLGFSLISASPSVSVVSKQSDGGYPPQVIDNFMTSCTSTAVQDGVSNQLANDICSCYIKEIQKEYTYTEFEDLDRQASQGEPLPQEFYQIVNDCVSQYQN